MQNDPLRFVAIINRDGGTIRTIDATAYCSHLETAFAEQGHDLDCRIVEGGELTGAMDKAHDRNDVDGVIAAGGDGTISFAGSYSWKSGKLLGIIPAGTMNLYARSLGVPLDIWAAASALAAGTPGVSDIVTANGRPYLHQFSVGFHPRMIRSRSRYNYRSRLGKIRASILSAIDTIRRPPVFPVVIETDEGSDERMISGLSISNNPYGEGHIPYADKIDSGRLGVYVIGPLTTGAGARVVADLMMGSWTANPDIDERIAKSVRLHFPTRRRYANSVIDGELMPLPRDVEFTMHPGELKVLLPERSAAGPDGIA